MNITAKDEPYCPRCSTILLVTTDSMDNTDLNMQDTEFSEDTNSSNDEQAPFSDEQGPFEGLETGCECVGFPCCMEQAKKAAHNWVNTSSCVTPPLNAIQWERRHSAVGMIEHNPADMSVSWQGEAATNTEAIQEFLSVCLRQFNSYTYEDGEEDVRRQRHTTREHGYHKESSGHRASISSHQCTTDNEITLQATGTSGAQRVCRYCSREMKPGVRGMQHHLEVCPKFPIKCPNMCGKMVVPREQLANHIIEDCPKATEICAYKHVGCSFQGSNNNLANHLEQSINDHLQLACQIVQDQRTELDRQKERVRKQDEAIYQLTETVTKLKSLFDEQMTTREDQEKVINKLTEQLKDHKKHHSKLEKEMKNKLAELEKKENIEVDQHRKLLRYPGLNGYGEQVWRIGNFGKRLARIRSGRGDDPICSEPFYTSAFGYKISCWAYLNGRGKEEGRSVSVYACVMYGEYDAILKWPIRPRYTFALLDQVSDVEDRKDIVRVRKVHDFKRDDVRRKGIERPNRDERAIIVGFDDFISHDELENGSYISDDCFFIRIFVDIQDN